MEIKNCTLVEEGVAMFPDAVTTRGQKHLDELVRLKQEGHRAVIFYLIQRMDAKIFTPAAMIDRVYAQKLKHAVENGVEIMRSRNHGMIDDQRVREAVKSGLKSAPPLTPHLLTK